MKYCPVPKNYSKNLSTLGVPGSFWGNRGDRHHFEVDV